MNSKKSKSKISSELRTLKLPYFRCEHDAANLDEKNLIKLFARSFNKNYLV